MIRHCARFNPKTLCKSSVECQGKSGRPSLLGERKKRNCLSLTMATCRGSVVIRLLLAYHFVADCMRFARVLLLESENPRGRTCALCLASDRRGVEIQLIAASLPIVSDEFDTARGAASANAKDSTSPAKLGMATSPSTRR